MLERSLRLDRVGAATRKHVEQGIRDYARTLARSEMVSTTPQGVGVGGYSFLVVLVLYLGYLLDPQDGYTVQLR